MTAKKFITTALILLLALLVLSASLVIFIDPFMYFHKPFSWLSYNMYSLNEPYINAGIIKNFEYDSVIIGTSMTENFLPSQADKLFDAKFIKTPYYGRSYFEISNLLEYPLSKKPVKNVIRCLDYDMLYLEKDKEFYKDSIPVYLYDDNIFNDVKYIFNKDVILGDVLDVIIKTANNGPAFNLDDYTNWNDSYSFNKESVLSTYTRKEKQQSQNDLDALAITVTENISQNIIEQARKHPDTTFYLYFSPYSIVYWDNLNQSNSLDFLFKAKTVAIEQMLEIDNIKLYSFDSNFDLITDLNNYKDITHYSQDINTDILNYMANDEYLLTKNNYQDILQKEQDFLINYDYNAIFE